MADRKTVIDAFERCFCTDNDKCPGCYKDGPGFGYACRRSLCEDVLVLLKEQEPVKPEKGYSGSGVTWWNICGNCSTAINPNDKFCHECGRAVKWDG